jgi:hypothetical protein
VSGSDAIETARVTTCWKSVLNRLLPEKMALLLVDMLPESPDFPDLGAALGSEAFTSKSGTAAGYTGGRPLYLSDESPMINRGAGP